MALGDDAEVSVGDNESVRDRGRESMGDNGLRRVVTAPEVHGKCSSGSRTLVRELKGLMGNVV